VRLGVIKTMRGGGDTGLTGSGIGSSGRDNDEATGGDGCRITLLIGGVSHGRGIRSRDEGPTCFFTNGLIGGKGISSSVGDLFHGVGIMGVASLCGGDGVSDGSNGTSMGSSMIMGGGSYCSIDEYCRRCCPQGTKGSGGVTMRGGPTGGGLGGVGMNGGANGDGSTKGGVVGFGITGGNVVVIGVDGGDFGI